LIKKIGGISENKQIGGKCNEKNKFESTKKRSSPKDPECGSRAFLFWVNTKKLALLTNFCVVFDHSQIYNEFVRLIIKGEELVT
jgi:hypothetical protein